LGAGRARLTDCPWRCVERYKRQPDHPRQRHWHASCRSTHDGRQTEWSHRCVRAPFVTCAETPPGDSPESKVLTGIPGRICPDADRRQVPPRRVSRSSETWIRGGLGSGNGGSIGTRVRDDEQEVAEPGIAHLSERRRRSAWMSCSLFPHRRAGRGHGRLIGEA
jgi:hypothetical protein